MDETENGRICKGYLKKIIGDKLEESEIVCWPHKNKLQISNVEIFNEIANKNKINKLGIFGGFHYYINISNGNHQNKWIVVLDSELSEEFLTKYGKDYKIN